MIAVYSIVSPDIQIVGGQNYVRTMLYEILTPQIDPSSSIFALIQHLFSSNFTEKKTFVLSICPSAFLNHILIICHLEKCRFRSPYIHT